MSMFTSRHITTAFVLLLMSSSLFAERIRLERESGAVNKAFQEMLSEQISGLSDGVGKIELPKSSEERSSCSADLFVSPETVYTVVDLKKAKSHVEFYVDHPHDSFKDVLFQALVKQGDQTELSVDKKSGGYKFSKQGSKLIITIKQQGDNAECHFDLAKAVFISGETE